MKFNEFKPLNEGLKNPKDNPCWKGYHPVGTKKKGGKTVPNCVPNANEAMNAAQQAAIAIAKKKEKKVSEAQFNSKQEVIDHFVKQGKSAAAGASAWERGWRGHTPKKKELKQPVRSYHDDLDDKRYRETNEDWQKVNKHDKTDGMSSKAVKAYRRENPGSKLKTAVTTKPSKLKAGSKDAKRRKSFCARMSGVKGPMKDEKGRPTAKAKALSRWNCESVEDLEQMLAEAALGVAEKRPKRPGSRPDRGHEPAPRYKAYCDACDRPKSQCVCDKEDLEEHKKGVRAMKYTKKAKGAIDPLEKQKEAPGRKVVGPKKVKQADADLKESSSCQFCGSTDHTSLDESGKASRSLCLSSKPDSELGASQLASCKSQGLRAREGKKSHKIGKTRVTVGGKKLKGKEYGGNLPDWS